jgi:hypothetical protein
VLAVGIWIGTLTRGDPEPARRAFSGTEQGQTVLIAINGAPVKATIFYDGAPVSGNPFRVSAASVSVPLRVEAPGYEPYVTTVVPRENTTLTVTLPPRPVASPAHRSTSTVGSPRPASRAHRPSGAEAPTSTHSTSSTIEGQPEGGPQDNASSSVRRSGRDTLYTEEFE